MTERILGPTGSRRRRRFLWVPMLLVACTALFVIAGAQAVHDLDFQLDGETTNVAYSPPGTSTPGKDWNSLFDVTNNTTAGTQTVANSSVIDTVNGPFA